MMSSSCLYVLRNAKEIVQLRSKLVTLTEREKLGVGFNPNNSLLAANSIKLNAMDSVFEVYDLESNVAQLLLSYEGYTVNGKQAELPLYQRMQILQEIALLCFPHASMLEVFLGDNNPYLPDYTVHKVDCMNVASVLLEEYQMDDTTPFIPCVHLVIEK